MDDLFDAADLGKLKWRCRRGLLENDLFLQRFFLRFESTLTVNQALALSDLMQLGDHDLLDLIMARKLLSQFDPLLNRPDVGTVLAMLKLKQPPERTSHEVI